MTVPPSTCSRCGRPLESRRISHRYRRRTSLGFAAVAVALLAAVVLTALMSGPLSPDAARFLSLVEQLLVGVAAFTWIWKRAEWKCPTCDAASFAHRPAIDRFRDWITHSLLRLEKAKRDTSPIPSGSARSGTGVSARLGEQREGAPNRRMLTAAIVMTAVVIGLAVIGFGLFVWPTAYRYDHVTLGPRTLPVRFHRITGRAERFFPSEGWVDETPVKQDETPVKPVSVTAIASLPQEQVDRVTGEGGLTGRGFFSARIYNGADWTVTELTIKVEAHERDRAAVRWQRLFSVPVEVNPLTTKSAAFDVIDDQNIGTVNWSIVSARGRPPK